MPEPMLEYICRKYSIVFGKIDDKFDQAEAKEKIQKYFNLLTNTYSAIKDFREKAESNKKSHDRVNTDKSNLNTN